MIRVHSSAGRALRSQRRGRGFESLWIHQERTPFVIQSQMAFFLGGVMFASRQVMLPAVVMSLSLVMCAPHVFIGKHRITASETSNITML